MHSVTDQPADRMEAATCHMKRARRMAGELNYKPARDLLMASMDSALYALGSARNDPAGYGAAIRHLAAAARQMNAYRVVLSADWVNAFQQHLEQARHHVLVFAADPSSHVDACAGGGRVTVCGDGSRAS